MKSALKNNQWLLIAIGLTILAIAITFIAVTDSEHAGVKAVAWFSFPLGFFWTMAKFGTPKLDIQSNETELHRFKKLRLIYALVIGFSCWTLQLVFFRFIFPYL